MYQIVASRFVVGLAAGNSAAATSFLSYATSQQERASILTINMAAAVLGFIAAPGFSAFTSLPSLAFEYTYRGFVFKFNQDTYPGYVSALFALFALPLMIPFKSIRPPKLNPDEKKPGFWAYFDKANGGANLVGVLIIYLSVFLFTIAFTIFETSGPLYVSEDPFIKFSVFYTSLMFGGLALVALLSIVFLRLVMKFFKNDRINLVIFGSLVSVGLFIVFCWENPFTGWVSMPRFLIGVFFIAFGFTVNQSLTTVVFSKILDGLEQGVMMGWMSSISSIARFISPIAATYVWGYVGHNWVLLTAGIATVISNVFIAAFYKSLRPRLVDDLATINDNVPTK
jgi:MFS family permease